LAAFPADAPVHYYFWFYRIPKKYFYEPSSQDDFRRALIVADLIYSQTAPSIIQQQRLEDILDGNQARVIYQERTAGIYELERKQSP
jgi:hypothetical protein